MGKTHRLYGQKARGIRITALLARDGPNCAICGRRLDRKIRNTDDPRFITFDHILPSSRGGTDELRNLRLAHRFCNEARADTPIEETPAP